METKKQQGDTVFTDEVYVSIQDWNAIRNDEVAVSAVLDQGNVFSFSITFDPLDSPYIHAYPAIIEGQMFFQVIASGDDKIVNFDIDERPPGVVTCEVTTKQLPSEVTGTITPKEAFTRLGNWEDTETREEWIGNATAAELMYQAFNIPSEDIVSGDPHNAFFALRYDSTASVYVADLIIINTSTNIVVSVVSKVDTTLGTTFYDMTKPVPPFVALDGRALINFGLLNYALA